MPTVMHYWPFNDPGAIVAIVLLLALAPWPKRKEPAR